MANMSYCRFENTNNDLRDCIEAAREEGFKVSELSSEYEKRGFYSLMEQIVAFAEEAEQFVETRWDDEEAI